MAATINTRFSTELPCHSANGVSKPKIQTMGELCREMCRTDTKRPNPPKAARLSTPLATKPSSVAVTETSTGHRNIQRLPTPARSPSTPYHKSSNVEKSKTTKLDSHVGTPDERIIQRPPIAAGSRCPVKFHCEHRDHTPDIAQDAETDRSSIIGCIVARTEQVKPEHLAHQTRERNDRHSVQTSRIRSANPIDESSSDDEEPIWDNPSAVSNKSDRISSELKTTLNGSEGSNHRRRSDVRGIAVPIGKSANKILERRAKAQQKPSKKSPKTEVAKFFLSR